jgi:hypothetical protein
MRKLALAGALTASAAALTIGIAPAGAITGGTIDGTRHPEVSMDSR